MAQYPAGNYDIDPDTTSGTELAALLNADEAAFASQHLGAARPTYITEGGLWTKADGSDVELYCYAGGVDYLIGKYVDADTEWLIKAGTVEVSGTAPTSPETGRPWYDGTDLWVWDGAEWDQIQTDTEIVPKSTNRVITITTHTVVAADAGKNLFFSNTGTVMVTVPDGLDVEFQCTLFNRSTGTINIQRSGTTLTINGSTSIADIMAEHGAAYLNQVASADWELIY